MKNGYTLKQQAMRLGGGDDFQNGGGQGTGTGNGDNTGGGGNTGNTGGEG